MNEYLIMRLAVGILIGLGAGYIGAFMVVRRMSLVGDALSHVALPGIAIALLFNLNPFLGAFTALFAAVAGIWFLEKNTDLPPETLVGIFFTISLAVGILITPEPELLEALFGDISKINLSDVIISSVLVIISLAAAAAISKGLTLGTISKELTQSMGISVNTVNFIFLILVSLVVALGIKVVGTLLMGSLVIIPAAASKNMAPNFSTYTLLAAIFGAAASLMGILVAQYSGFSPGPMVVLAGGLIFVLSLFFKK